MGWNPIIVESRQVLFRGVSGSCNKPYQKTSIEKIRNNQRLRFAMTTNSTMLGIATNQGGLSISTCWCHEDETAEAAHNFRNILGIVSMLSELAEQELPHGSSVISLIQRIRQTCAEGSDLCNRMMDDCQKAHDAIELVNLSDRIDAVVPLLSVCLPSESRLVLKLNDRTSLVEVVPEEIRQVVINLVRNAAEALRDGERTITVSTGAVESVEIGTTEAAHLGSRKHRPYSYISVSDTGCGMDEMTTANLFKRRFTTKRDGHGLGMMSVQRIVSRYGGLLQVNSQMRGGTQVVALFPRAQ